MSDIDIKYNILNDKIDSEISHVKEILTDKIANEVKQTELKLDSKLDLFKKEVLHENQETEHQVRDINNKVSAIFLRIDEDRTERKKQHDRIFTLETHDTNKKANLVTRGQKAIYGVFAAAGLGFLAMNLDKIIEAIIGAFVK